MPRRKSNKIISGAIDAMLRQLQVGAVTERQREFAEESRLNQARMRMMDLGIDPSGLMTDDGFDWSAASRLVGEAGEAKRKRAAEDELSTRYFMESDPSMRAQIIGEGIGTEGFDPELWGARAGQWRPPPVGEAEGGSYLPSAIDPVTGEVAYDRILHEPAVPFPKDAITRLNEMRDQAGGLGKGDLGRLEALLGEQFESLEEQRRWEQKYRQSLDGQLPGGQPPGGLPLDGQLPGGLGFQETGPRPPQQPREVRLEQTELSPGFFGLRVPDPPPSGWAALGGVTPGELDQVELSPRGLKEAEEDAFQDRQESGERRPGPEDIARDTIRKQIRDEIRYQREEAARPEVMSEAERLDLTLRLKDGAGKPIASYLSSRKFLTYINYIATISSDKNHPLYTDYDNGVFDVLLVNSFYRGVADPDSVVRGVEFDNLTETLDFPARTTLAIRNALGISTARLNSAIRKNLVDLAQMALTVERDSMRDELGSTLSIATSYGIDPRFIIGSRLLKEMEAPQGKVLSLPEARDVYGKIPAPKISTEFPPGTQPPASELTAMPPPRATPAERDAFSRMGFTEKDIREVMNLDPARRAAALGLGLGATQ